VAAQHGRVLGGGKRTQSESRRDGTHLQGAALTRNSPPRRDRRRSFGRDALSDRCRASGTRVRIPALGSQHLAVLGCHRLCLRHFDREAAAAMLQDQRPQPNSLLIHCYALFGQNSMIARQIPKYSLSFSVLSLKSHAASASLAIQSLRR
jgi:hypothetical protein